MEFLGFGGGTIAFDYGRRTILFAQEIDEDEAIHIIDKLKERGFIMEEKKQS
ncbi:MAG: hypothetical protein ACE5K0_02950 [Candidatus Methanofastidiosia archaeon]